MRRHSGAADRRIVWSTAVWVAVVLSGVVVRNVIGANDSDLPFAFPLAALWLVAAVCAIHWTVSQWMGRQA